MKRIIEQGIFTNMDSFENRPGKSVQSSSDPELDFLYVPPFWLYNLVNTLNSMSRKVFDKANKEQLRMICMLKYNSPALKSKDGWEVTSGRSTIISDIEQLFVCVQCHEF